MEVAHFDSAEVLSRQTITAPNPATRGSFGVKYLTYGSGTDKNRPEFKDSVTYKVKAVDVSAKQLTIKQEGNKGFEFDVNFAVAADVESLKLLVAQLKYQDPSKPDFRLPDA